MPEFEDRCRLVLVAPAAESPDALAGLLEGALSGGDVASVVLPQRDLDDKAFQDVCATVVPVSSVMAGTMLDVAVNDSAACNRVSVRGRACMSLPEPASPGHQSR